MLGFLRAMPGYRLLIILCVGLVAAFVAMLVLRGRSTSYQVAPAERYCIDQAAADAAQALAQKLPLRKVLLTPLANDDGYAGYVLARRLTRTEGFEVVEQKDLKAAPSVVKKVEEFIKSLFATPDPDRVSVRPAVEAAKEMGVPAVIFGRVTERNTSGGRTTFEVALRTVRSNDGTTVFAKAFDADLRHTWTSPAYVGVWMGARAWWARFLVWIAVTALVPLAAAPAARPLLRQESNALNAAVLLFLTAVSALAAWLLAGLGSSAATWVLVALAGLAAAAYNWVLYDRLADVAG